MSNFKERLCKNCGEIFLPASEKNVFCSRRCFKQSYYHRKKAEELLSVKGFPTFKCPHCDQVIKLDFDPVIDSLKWIDFTCPMCNVLMINVSEYIITGDVPIA